MYQINSNTTELNSSVLTVFESHRSQIIRKIKQIKQKPAYDNEMKQVILTQKLLKDRH